MDGWIKLHRRLTEWEWYTDANTMRVFIHCLIKANHTDKKWRGIEVKRGQFIGSYDSVAKELNLTVSKVRTSLKKLILTREMTIKGCNQHTVFTVENYDSFQSLTSESQTDDNQIAIKSQTDDNQIAATKNLKNVKNERKDINTTSSNSKESTGKVKKSKFKYSDDDMTFAEWMFKLIEKVSPSAKEPSFSCWANTIRLMRESDGLEHRHMAETFKWANQDSFWYVNILSPKKLREKFTQLDAKRMQSTGETNEKTINGNVKRSGKLSAAERVAQRNADRYGTSSSGLCMGENGGDIRGAMDTGERGRTFENVDSCTQQAIHERDQDWNS